jgi:hypothetical protein
MSVDGEVTMFWVIYTIYFCGTNDALSKMLSSISRISVRPVICNHDHCTDVYSTTNDSRTSNRAPKLADRYVHDYDLLSFTDVSSCVVGTERNCDDDSFCGASWMSRSRVNCNSTPRKPNSFSQNPTISQQMVEPTSILASKSIFSLD